MGWKDAQQFWSLALIQGFKVDSFNWCASRFCISLTQVIVTLEEGPSVEKTSLDWPVGKPI